MTRTRRKPKRPPATAKRGATPETVAKALMQPPKKQPTIARLPRRPAL